MMGARLILLLGAILVSCVALVGALAPKGVIQLNELLTQTTEPNDNSLEANVAAAEAKNDSGYGWHESDLKNAVGKFLTLARAESCPLEVVNAFGYLARNRAEQTRLNVVLHEEIWQNKGMRERCQESLVNLAREFNSKLSRDDGMQTFLDTVKYQPRRYGRHQVPGEFVTPVSINFAPTYLENQGIARELVAIAKAKSMVIAPSKGDGVKSKIGRIENEKVYQELVEKYFENPCESQLHLSTNLISMIDLIMGRSGVAAKDNEKFDDLPEEVRDVYYRTRACSIFKANRDDATFKQTCKESVFEAFSKRQPAHLKTWLQIEAQNKSN